MAIYFPALLALSGAIFSLAFKRWDSFQRLAGWMPTMCAGVAVFSFGALFGMASDVDAQTKLWTVFGVLGVLGTITITVFVADSLADPKDDGRR